VPSGAGITRPSGFRSCGRGRSFLRAVTCCRSPELRSVLVHRLELPTRKRACFRVSKIRHNIKHHIMMCYNTNMSMRAIQVSMDEDLLKRIDGEPEVKERGRSAFIRSAIRVYLKAKRRREIDDEISRAYEGCADDMLDEVADLVGAQAWPED